MKKHLKPDKKLTSCRVDKKDYEERNRHKYSQMYLLTFRRLHDSCRIPVTNNHLLMTVNSIL